MEKLPNIYVLKGLPSLGEMGIKTKAIHREYCDICNKGTTEYDPFSYVFAQWNGEDLISVAGNYYLVSERLKKN